MVVSEYDVKRLKVEMWILKDFGQFSGELYGDATTGCKVGIFGRIRIQAVKGLAAQLNLGTQI